MHRRLTENPVLAGVLGALTIAFSAILVDLADVTPASAALWRCAYALPVLAPLAWLEHRRYGPRTARERRLAAIAGGAAVTAMVFFTASCAQEEEKAPEETTTTTTTTTETPPSPTEKAPRLEPGGPNPFSPSVIAPPAPTATPTPTEARREET